MDEQAPWSIHFNAITNGAGCSTGCVGPVKVAELKFAFVKREESVGDTETAAIEGQHHEAPKPQDVKLLHSEVETVKAGLPGVALKPVDFMDLPLLSELKINETSYMYLSLDKTSSEITNLSKHYYPEIRDWMQAGSTKTQMARLRQCIMGCPIQVPKCSMRDATFLASVHYSQFEERLQATWAVNEPGADTRARFEHVRAALQTLYVYTMSAHYFVLRLGVENASFNERLQFLSALLWATLTDDRLHITTSVPKPRAGGGMQPKTYWKNMYG